jgi:hypothetical protein
MEGKILTLINLVDTSEGDLGELLQRHHVDGRRHRLLAARLRSTAQLNKFVRGPGAHNGDTLVSLYSSTVPIPVHI